VGCVTACHKGRILVKLQLAVDNASSPMKKRKSQDPKIASPPGYTVLTAAKMIITAIMAIVNLVEVSSLIAIFI
jgi:hypothetical protein